MKNIESISKEVVDLVFKEHIATIRQVIYDNFDKNCLSIFLYGSYGRDEGGWYFDEDTQSYRPYNDYDIAIFVNEHASPSFVKEIEIKLLDLLPVRWIDIAQYTITDLQRLKISIKNYDLKFASKNIGGDKTLLRHIKNFTPENISLKDIEILFNTRVFTLVGSIKGELNDMSEDDTRFFRNQMSKAILATVDCVLLLNQAYESSYRSRVKKINHYSDDEDLINLAKWAIDEKLYPKSTHMSEDEILVFHQAVQSIFFRYFFMGLSEAWNKDINSPDDVRNHMLYSIRNFFRRGFYLILGRGEASNRDIYMVIAQVYIAFYFHNPTEKVTAYLNLILKKMFSSVESLSFNQARVTITKIRGS